MPGLQRAPSSVSGLVNGELTLAAAPLTIGPKVIVLICGRARSAAQSGPGSCNADASPTPSFSAFVCALYK